MESTLCSKVSREETAVEIGHKHVSFTEVETLFADRFVIEQIHYSGLFMPVFAWLLSIDASVRLLPRRWHDQLARFQGWESGIPCGPLLSYNIRIIARKKHAAASGRHSPLLG